MGKYLHEFVSKIDFLKKYFGDDYLQPWASLTTSNYQSDYNRKKRKLSKMPLTTVPLTNDSTTFTFAIAANVNTDTLESISYSVDGGETWTTTPNVDATAVNIPVTVTNKTPVMWKGVGKAISVSDGVYSRLYANKNFEALGNPLSLIGEQYNLKSLINNAWALAHLFHNATTLINADKLILSAKKCGERCYHKMFDTCSNLETFPILPAISLANGCYAYMFSTCRKMVTPVAVPATKLDQYCYAYMFSGCTGLTSIPELPAMNLYQYCYQYMFNGCTGLVDCEINLPAVTMAQHCYERMFQDCTNLTTVPELPATSLAPNCYNGMFRNTAISQLPLLPATKLESNCYSIMFMQCSKLIDLSEYILPATILADGCYNQMFDNCINLKKGPQLPATTLTTNCYASMFYGCKSLIDTPALIATTLNTRCYQSMFSGCTSLTNMPEIIASNMSPYCCVSMFNNCTGLTSISLSNVTTLANNCFQTMFKGCTGLTSIPELPWTSLPSACMQGMFQNCINIVNIPSILPATTLNVYCYREMFYGCTSLTKAPALPAATATNTQCYYQMFYGCTNLNNITALFTNNPNSANNCQYQWVQGVSSTGTFIMSGNAEWNPESYRGVNGVPEGWTVNRITPTLETDDGNTTYAIASSANQISINGTDLLTSYTITLNDPDNVFTIEESNLDDTYDITCSDHTALHTATLTVSSPGATDLVLILVNNDGTLPNGYKRVGCVEADGNQQVDLNLIMFETAPVDYGVQLIGYLDNTSAAYGTLLANISETNPYPGTAIRKNNNTAFVQSRVSGVSSDIIGTNTLFATNYTGTESSAFNCKTTLFGAINTTNGNWWRFGKGRIYGCKIFINNTLVRNLIPCIENSTNIVGLYDVVNNVFYTSETNPLTYTN